MISNDNLPLGIVGGIWATRPMNAVRFATILANKARSRDD